MMFWKRQHYNDGDQISSFQGLAIRVGIDYTGGRRERFWGEGTVLFLDYGGGYMTAIVKIYRTVHLKI